MYGFDRLLFICKEGAMEHAKQLTGLCNEVDAELPFREKVRIFSHSYLKCCFFIEEYAEKDLEITKKLYLKLTYSAQILEDFLDFHGAKNNEDWFFYRELSAAVRHISLCGYSQKHVLHRLDVYNLKDSDAFRMEGEKTLSFITETLVRIAPVVLEEARRLHIPMPEKTFDFHDFPDFTTGEALKNNIVDDLNRAEYKKHIVKIASQFLDISRSFDEFVFYTPYAVEDIYEIVPQRINEVEIRRYEMLVHNLQSHFDTYVTHWGIATTQTSLRDFRSHFSVVFHLLQLMGRLLHFYERHLHEAGFKDIYKSVQKRLIALVNPEVLLDRTINYGLFYVCNYLMSGKELVQNILNENIERGEITVPVPKDRGFHCRPSLLVSQVVQHYGGQVDLRVRDHIFDAGSVLDIQWAGGKIQNEHIQEVIFQGDSRALKDLEILARFNYGEDAFGKGIPLPKELNYLN